MTQCECELAGFCKRHNVEKDEISHELCKTNEQAFLMMEKEAGTIGEQEYHGIQAERKPSFLKQVYSLAKDGTTHLMDGLATVDDTEFERRIKICESCPLFNLAARRCSLCGCFMDTKANWRTGICPDTPSRW